MVILHHYGDPFRDPHVSERISTLAERRFPLWLSTNATRVERNHIELLKRVDRSLLHSFHFTYPSANQREWSRWMGLNEIEFPRADATIEAIIREFGGEVPINIVVNSVSGRDHPRVRSIKKRFRAYDGRFDIVIADTRSRGGAIENGVVNIAHHREQYFAGCLQSLNWLNVSAEGKVFLCCDDYHQQHVLGDLLTDDIQSIMAGPHATQIMSEIWGEKPMGSDRICRNCSKLIPADKNMASKRVATAAEGSDDLGVQRLAARSSQ